MVRGIERRHRTVVKVRAVLTRLALLRVDTTVRSEHADGRAVLREAPFGADAVGNLLDRVVRQRLVRNAAVPRRAGALLAVAAQRARFRVVDLHVDLRVVLERLAGLLVNPLRPVQVVHILLGPDELSVGAVDRVVEAVARIVADHLPQHAIDLDVVQHVDADLVEVPRVVRRVLEVPRELAGAHVDRNHRVRVQVVARTELRVVDRVRVAGADDVEMRRRIERAGLPDAAAAGLPGAVVVLPGLAAGVARLRYGVEAPLLVTGLGVESGDPAARAAVARAVLHDDDAVGDERRRVEFLLAAELVFGGDALVPHDLAVVAIDRDDAAIGQVGEDPVFPERDAARARLVAGVPHGGVSRPDNFPLVARRGVDLVDRAPAVGRVEHAVVDQHVHFGFRSVLTDVLHSAERHAPDHPEVLHVLPVDLRQLREAGVAVIAVHEQPVLLLVLGVDEPILAHRHLVSLALPDDERRAGDDAHQRHQHPRVCTHFVSSLEVRLSGAIIGD